MNEKPKYIRKSKEHTAFETNATVDYALGKSLYHMAWLMIQHREEDGASEYNAIHCWINATNGYVEFSWFDEEEQKNVGETTYFLFLKGLHKKSLNHPDGASFFDSEVRFGCVSLVEEMIDWQEEEKVDELWCYISTELYTTPEKLLI